MFTRTQLASLFYIDLDGELRWLVARTSGNGKPQVKPGDVAGWSEPDGGRRVQIDGKTFQVSHIVWCLTEGEWPKGIIDHRDGTRGNNRIGNLRAATHAQNSRNRKIRKGNASGHTGVDWFKPLGKWRARITVNYKQIVLGHFVFLEEAVAARKTAEAQHFKDFVRSNARNGASP